MVRKSQRSRLHPKRSHPPRPPDGARRYVTLCPLVRKRQQELTIQEEVNDGSGSIMDFRVKLRTVQTAEATDKWVSYEWAYGIVSFETAILYAS